MGKKHWTLDQKAFDRLLACLDTDRERAGEKYETMRRKLVKYFEWRHCRPSEDLADETLNRVSRKLIEGEAVQDFPSYCYGVARRLHLETLKRPGGDPLSIEDGNWTMAQGGLEALESRARLNCFNRCLQELPPDSRELIVSYYEEEKGAKIASRRQLAQGLGIPANALRLRVHRVRERLEVCVTDCMKKIS